MHTLTIDARMIHASGIGNYLQNLIPYVLKEFKTYLIGDPDKLLRYPWAAEATIIPCTVPIYSFKEQVEFVRQIPRCDVFWSPHYNIPLLPIKARKRIVTIHDAYHLAYRHTLSLPQQLYARVLLKAAVTKSDRVLTVSQFSKRELSHYTGTPAANFNVIYLGLDTNVFKLLDKVQSMQQLKPIYPALPSDYILYVGNVKPHKNLKTLVHAFSLLQQEYNLPHSLVIVGRREGFITADEQLNSTLEEDLLLKDKVYFTGFVEDEHLPLIYNSASLFVFPSIYEGFGIPPLEAMGCGCPVLASDAASIPEISGPAVMLFKPDNAIELKEKLYTLLTNKNLSNELIQRGQKHVLNYPWKASAEKHIQVIAELINA